ncbi:MAG: sensor histidine kinase [Janthinobacterium lividum]
MSLRPDTKFALGFAGALAVLLLSGAAALLSIQGLQRQTEQVQHTYQVIQETDAMNAVLRDAQTGVRGYRLTGDTAFLHTYYKAVRQLPSLQAGVRRLSQGHPTQQARLDSLRAVVDLEFRVLRPLANFNAALSRADLLAALTTDRLTMRAARTIFRRVKDEELRLLNQRSASQSVFERAAPRVVIGAGVLALLLVGWLLARITRELRDNRRLQAELAAVNADVARRIGAIRDLAEQVVRGDYTVKIADAATDGLGNLAALLNQMTQSLDQSFEALALRNRELDQFAYVASHDLRAPLRGIATLVKWLDEEHAAEFSPEVRTYFDQVKGRLGRLEGLISGLLAYARAGRVARPPAVTDVGALLREAAELVVPPGFVLNLPPDLPTFSTDRQGLQQVFTNLLDNAVKHHQGPGGHIAVHCRDAGGHYEFAVADDGPGIAPAHHHKIFQLFQTLRERHAAAESTGIGLSIVKKLVEEQPGSVRVESARGQGATFIFTWPKEAAPAARLAVPGATLWMAPALLP